MEILRQNQAYPVNVLKINYEYCAINYYAEGERNDLGEPSRILLKRADNILCSIDPIVKMLGYIGQTGLRDIVMQGIVERSLFVMTLLANQVILPGDVVSDCGGTSYDVLKVYNFETHKEAFLRLINR